MDRTAHERSRAHFREWFNPRYNRSVQQHNATGLFYSDATVLHGRSRPARCERSYIVRIPTRQMLNKLTDAVHVVATSEDANGIAPQLDPGPIHLDVTMPGI